MPLYLIIKTLTLLRDFPYQKESMYLIILHEKKHVFILSGGNRLFPLFITPNKGTPKTNQGKAFQNKPISKIRDKLINSAYKLSKGWVWLALLPASHSEFGVVRRRMGQVQFRPFVLLREEGWEVGDFSTFSFKIVIDAKDQIN